MGKALQGSSPRGLQVPVPKSQQRAEAAQARCLPPFLPLTGNGFLPREAADGDECVK